MLRITAIPSAPSKTFKIEGRIAGNTVEELRRRASERSRPRLERDYIERLLKQF